LIGIILGAVLILVLGLLFGVVFAMRSDALRRRFPWMPLPSSWAAPERIGDEIEIPELNDRGGDLDVALDDDEEALGSK